MLQARINTPLCGRPARAQTPSLGACPQVSVSSEMRLRLTFSRDLLLDAWDSPLQRDVANQRDRFCMLNQQAPLAACSGPTGVYMLRKGGSRACSIASFG